jgi:hypothetical protein
MLDTLPYDIIVKIATDLDCFERFEILKGTCHDTRVNLSQKELKSYSKTLHHIKQEQPEEIDLDDHNGIVCHDCGGLYGDCDCFWEETYDHYKDRKDYERYGHTHFLYCKK